MGQKVHPTGIRLGIVKKHTSVWFAEGKNYAENLLIDLQVRQFIRKRLAAASVSRVEIERPAQTARITIFTARPGIVIGKKGEDIESLKGQLQRMLGVAADAAEPAKWSFAWWRARRSMSTGCGCRRSSSFVARVAPARARKV